MISLKSKGLLLEKKNLLQHHSSKAFILWHSAFFMVQISPPYMTSGKIDGEKAEIVTDFIFLGSKMTTHGDCSHEIERQLLPGRKAMGNVDSVLKSRDIT